ncbi:MAG: hypothetical protein GXP10_01160 [Gammaproteobacteria bacterium]|nr:hypothetical protein [Gammaproteobacteria bacterium]
MKWALRESKARGNTFKTAVYQELIDRDITPRQLVEILKLNINPSRISDIAVLPTRPPKAGSTPEKVRLIIAEFLGIDYSYEKFTHRK